MEAPGGSFSSSPSVSQHSLVSTTRSSSTSVVGSNSIDSSLVVEIEHRIDNEDGLVPLPITAFEEEDQGAMLRDSPSTRANKYRKVPAVKR